MKSALVTGGSRGIGRAISIKLAEMGYYTLINYKSNREEAEKTLDTIKTNGGAGEIIQFDVSDKVETIKQIEQWTEANKEKYIEVLVNNSGITRDGLMIWLKDEDWEEVINTNLNGVFYVTRLLIKDMIVRKYGRIINMVSLSGQSGMAGQTNYAASKGAIIAATKSLAREVGKKNVTVNAVSPGFIRTDMTKNLNEDELKRTIPLNRFGTVEEVAELVGFIASEKSAYITGEVISINGGIY